MAVIDCSSKESGDYYGLGVRVGIYCIWFTSYLANNFLPGEVSSGLDANFIFLLALLITIFKGTMQHGDAQLRQIDGLVLMELCCGYIFGCFSLWGYRTVHFYKEGRRGIRHFGRIGTHVRLLLCTAISAYGIWFWSEGIFDGLDVLRLENGQKRKECYPLDTFFFAKLPVRGGIHILYIIMTIGCTLYFGIMLTVAICMRAYRAWEVKSLFTKGRYETGLSSKQLRFIFLFCRFGNLAWIIFSILTIEMTVRWGKVRQVEGGLGVAAQLLPFLIGLCGLIRVIYLMYKEYWLEKEEEMEEEKEEKGLGVNIQPTPEVVQSPTPEKGPVESTDAVHCCDDEVPVEVYDRELAGRSLTVRYLVAWLPWLAESEHLWRRNVPVFPEHDSEAAVENPPQAVTTATSDLDSPALTPSLGKELS